MAFNFSKIPLLTYLTFVILFATHYGLTFCLFMGTLYDTTLGPTLFLQTYTITQPDLMPKSLNELRSVIDGLVWEVAHVFSNTDHRLQRAVDAVLSCCTIDRFTGPSVQQMDLFIRFTLLYTKQHRSSFCRSCYSVSVFMSLVIDIS